MLTRDDIEKAVADVAPKYGAVRVRLFGSHARGEANESSDVDLVVDFERLIGFALGGMFLDLEERLSCDVDIVCGADQLYPFVRASFDEEAVAIYETDELSAFMIQRIISNARMIEERIEEFEIDEAKFSKSTVYQDMLTMPMLRIGEIVAKYKEAFKAMEPGYPWDEIVKKRCKIAHPYGGSTFFFVWEAIQEDLPDIVNICERHLQN